MNNEETTEYMKQRIELRRIYDEDVCRLITSGNYETLRSILETNPDIKFFIEPSQWVKIYDYFVEGKVNGVERILGNSEADGQC